MFIKLYKVLIPVRFFGHRFGNSWASMILFSLVILSCCLWTTGLSRLRRGVIRDEWNNSSSTNNTDRIVGGVDTDITHHPHQVSLELNNKHYCGASIIKTYWIVTAAHCVHGRAPESLRVRAGSSYKGTGGSIHQATNAIVHPFYNSDVLDFDVAVIKVSDPFVYSTAVKPISLSDNEPPVGTIVTITGWGSLFAGGPSPDVLQRVEVCIIDRWECASRYGDFPVTDRMICAEVPGGGKDHCYGDSGGPVVADGDLVGIVSWAEGCAHPRFPGVSTNVARMNRWIIQTTRSKRAT